VRSFALSSPSSVECSRTGFQPSASPKSAPPYRIVEEPFAQNLATSIGRSGQKNAFIPRSYQIDKMRSFDSNRKLNSCRSSKLRLPSRVNSYRLCLSAATPFRCSSAYRSGRCTPHGAGSNKRFTLGVRKRKPPIARWKKTQKTRGWRSRSRVYAAAKQRSQFQNS